MTIRKTGTADLSGLLRLYGELNPEDDYSATEKFRNILKAIVADPLLPVFVLETDGEIASSCYLNIIPNLSRGGRPYAVIENVITAAKHREKGFGSLLMKHALEYARLQDCYKVMLLTGRKEENVHRFYRSLGFDGDSKKAYQIRF